MSIPDFQSIMLPLLKIANNGKIHMLRKASESLAEYFGLNDSEMSVLISSGQPKFVTTYLVFFRNVFKII